MVIDNLRSLHHVSGPTLEGVEATLLKMNITGHVAIEVFQVQKIQGLWFAHFNLSIVKFNQIIKEMALVQKPERIKPPEVQLDEPKLANKKGRRKKNARKT